MLVTNCNVYDLLRSYAQRAERTQTSTSPKVSTEAEAHGKRTDSLVLSQGAQEVQRALSALKETPEVRQELVAELRQRIKDGSYEVDVQGIAELLLSDEDE
jgi:negative regulator of flagellin synthesis FlgM